MMDDDDDDDDDDGDGDLCSIIVVIHFFKSYLLCD